MPEGGKIIGEPHAVTTVPVIRAEPGMGVADIAAFGLCIQICPPEISHGATALRQHLHDQNKLVQTYGGQKQAVQCMQRQVAMIGGMHP